MYGHFGGSRTLMGLWTFPAFTAIAAASMLGFSMSTGGREGGGGGCSVSPELSLKFRRNQIKNSKYLKHFEMIRDKN